MGTAREAANKIRKKRQLTDNTSISAKQVAEKIKLYNSLPTESVNESYINTFLSDSQDFLNSAEKSYSSLGWSNASSTYENISNTWKDLNTRHNTIRGWLYKNKNSINKETYDSVSKSLDSFNNNAQSIISGFEKALNAYSQFETEDAYNEWKKFYDWSKSILEAEDFLEKSQYVSTYRGGEEFNAWAGMYTDTGYEDIMYDYINRDKRAIDRQALSDLQSNAAILGLDNSERKEMSDDEIKIFNYLYATQGSDVAYDYIKKLTSDLNYRQRAAEMAQWEKFADESPVGASIFSVLSSPLKGLSYLGQLADYTADGKIDENEGYNKFSYINSAIRNEVAEDMNGVGSFIYQTGMSIGDFLFTTAVSGGNSALSLSIMGSGAAADTVIASKDMGLSDDQAFWLGTAAGAVEVATEKIGIDALLDIKALKGSTGKYILKNILAEGTEEGLSNIGNTVAELVDLVLNDDESKIKREINAIMQEQNVDESTAIGKYVTGKFKELGLDVLGGAISGGVMAGTVGAIQNVKANKTASKIYGESTADLVAESLELDPNNKYAQKMQNRLDSGKSLSGGQINRLIDTNETTMLNQDISAIQNVAKERLAALGETGNIETVAKALAKQAQGEKLTSSEKQAIKNSKYGQRVANELNTDNIRSGQYSSAWAEQIGTNRINAEEYSQALADAEVVTDTKPKIISENGKTKIGDTEISIKEVASVKDGEVILRLEDDSTVNAKDVEFGSNAEGLFIENVVDMNLNAATANAFIRGYNPSEGLTAQEYILGFREAYKYGEYAFPIQEMSQDGFSAKLSQSQKELAYGLGKTDAKYKTEAKQKAITEKSSATVSKKEKVRKGKVYYEGGALAKSMTARQKASLKGLETLAEALNIDFHIFESKVDANGKRKGANGWFNPKDGSIHIDLYAGQNSESTMLFTAAHELTHFIREWSPAKFKVFADFLLAQYGQKGISVEELVNRQIEKAKRNGRDIDYDTAYEEVIADSCETMLADGDAIAKIAELKAKDKTLWQKIKDFITDLVAKIKAVYEGLSPDTIEGRYVSEMLDSAEKLKALWTEALVDASDSYIAAEKILAENGIAVDSETDSASLLSVRDVLSDDQRQKVSTALAERFGVTQEEAMAWLKAETSMASLILNPKYSQYLDYTADPNEVAIKQNSDYPQGTVDFSPICAKRREFTSVMNNILRLFPNHVFAATDLAKIRSIMQEEGMTIPCGICYVEDRRQLDTIVAQNFIDSLKLYREGSKTRPDGKAFNTNQLKGLKLTDGDNYTPSIYELVSLEGLNVLKEKNPNMAEAWVKFNNARGMQSVRLLANEAEYKRQILKYDKRTVKSKNDKGGLRVYSFSDAEMFHLIDIIQVITDSATVGLSLQGYTKVNEYAKAVKDTGEKLNRSLIPKGELGYHIEDGKVVLDYDTVEGIDINHPDFFDNKDNPNVGNITIGVSDVQIRAAMVSNFVDQIIPFHTGQSEEVLGEKGIATWSNYKDFQTEKDIATDKVSDHQINIYTEVLQVLENEGKPITKKTFVEKFLQVCKENNLIPRFSQFLNTNEKGEFIYTEGYHKMLVDFKTFAQTEVGEYLPQKPVNPIFDDGYITRVMKEYVKSQKVKDADIAKSMPKVIERITNEIVKPNDAKLSDRDSEGNTLSKEQQEFFKDSKVRDKKGNLIALYHGTNSHFTVFDSAFSDDKRSFFLTDSANVAHSYASSSKILNPYDYLDENSSPQTTAEIAEKYVSEWKKVKAVDQHRIDDANKVVSKSIDTVIDNVKTVVDMTIGTRLERSFFVQSLESSLQHLESWKKLGKVFADINPFRVVHTKGEAILNLSKRGDIELSKELSSYLESLVDEAKKLEPLLDIAKAYSSGNGTVFEVTSNLDNISYESDVKVRKYINWSQSGGLMALYANLTNPLIVDANGRRWNNIKRLPGMDNTYADIINTRTVSEFAHKNGYDGVIFKGLVDIGGYSTVKSQRSTVVVAFDSNQIKSVDNKTPSYDPDIRYSDRYQAAEENPDILSMTARVESGDFKANDKVYLGTVSNNIAKQIHKLTGVNVEGFKVAIEARQIEHILKDHGKNGASDKSMANPSDIAKIEYAIKNYDDIRSAGKTQAYTHMVNGKNKTVNTVLYEKAIGEKAYYVVQAVPDTKAKTLYIVTAFIGKKGYKKEVSQLINANSLDVTAKTGSATTSNSSIAQNTENVNKKFSDRDPDSISNRSLLANALESVAQNDTEKNKLAQYKAKIELIELEQAKLSELRAKIKELSFAKGAKDTETIKILQFEANQTANRINTYDKQLLNLESTKALKNVLEREKEMARKRERQKGKEALTAYREKATQTQRELMTRYQESRKKGIESRHKTEMRHKIHKIVSELNQTLLNPTKEKHVPIGLQKPVAEALAIINMDTVGAEERIAKYDALIAKAKDPDKIEALKKSRDNIELQGESLKDRLEALKNAYAAFVKSEDPLIRNAHNEAIENLIENTAEKVGNTSLRNMSYEQLEAVYDMFKAIRATVRNANKMFKEGRQETVSENSSNVSEEIRKIGGHRNRELKALKAFKKYGWNMFKPITAMKVIGSKTFENLFNNVRAGEDTWAVDVSEAKEFFRDKAKQYNYWSWDFKKQYSFKDGTNRDFSLSLEQIMSLYAYSKRNQADRHLEVGGFVFDDAIEVTEKKHGIPLKYTVNDANPYRLNKEGIAEVISALTEEQKQFLDEMQAYLSDVMGAKGNEVSLAMYDIKLYNEKNYFPLKTAKHFREFNAEQSATPNLKNSGFSKKTVPQAGNPIVLSNFMDVWSSHVNDMSMYHAFVLPLEDFMRVYNYSSTAGGYDSVQQYIKNAYGSQANTYIETLLKDLNGGARVDTSADLVNKGISLFKKASVFASASVVIQQPSAMARAMAYIHPKYFATNPHIINHKAEWAELKKYAPIAIIKEMGYFDTNVGKKTTDWITERKYEGVAQKSKAVFTDSGYRDELLSKAPAMADELSWTYIWEAVKKETKSTTKLEGEELLKQAGKRFTEVIANTQVYDSVLSRSAMMRSKDTGMKMATAFMAEPTTVVNMMIDGIIQKKRGNKKFLASTVGAVSASIILNSILVSLVYAARDDDEDETYPEKYLGSLTTELIDGFNPITYLPFAKDIWSIAQGYDVERSDMSVWSKLVESVESLFSETKSGWEKTEEVVGAISSLFGLPFKNILRDARGIYNLYSTLSNDLETTSQGISDAIEDSAKSSIPFWKRIEKSMGVDESKSDKLYEAIMSGDQTHINRVKAQYATEQALTSAIRSALRENDTRIHEAAQARYNGDITTYKQIAKEIIAEGRFSQDDVVAAINAEINTIKKGETSAENQSDDTEEEATSIYKASDINSAFENGDNTLALEIINDLINTKIANGMEEKNARSSIRSSMTSYWKPLYKEAYQNGDANEMQRIRYILFNSGLYGNGNEVVKTVQNWLKD